MTKAEVLDKGKRITGIIEAIDQLYNNGGVIRFPMLYDRCRDDFSDHEWSIFEQIVEKCKVYLDEEESRDEQKEDSSRVGE